MQLLEDLAEFYVAYIFAFVCAFQLCRNGSRVKSDSNLSDMVVRFFSSFIYTDAFSIW